MKEVDKRRRKMEAKERFLVKNSASPRHLFEI
jgi:hypothetical protein